jgi:thioester reductase-like protein
VTGAAGCLGREVVRAVLESGPGTSVVALVRRGVRARDRARDLRAWLEWTGSDFDPGRLSVVAGDVSLPELGLSPITVGSLARRLTHVVHAAADLRMEETRETLARVNEVGMRGALRLAKRCERLVSFTQVSTAYVATEDGRRRNAYETSKAVVEEVVAGAGVPWLVVRPSVLMGARAGGRFARALGPYVLLRGVAHRRLSRLPVRSDVTLDVVPVDWCAERIVEVAAARPGAARVHLLAALDRAPRTGDVVASAQEHAGLGSVRLDPGAAAGRFAALLAYAAESVRPSTAGVDAVHRGPAPEEFLPASFRYCAETRWMRDRPWLASEAPAEASA